MKQFTPGCKYVAATNYNKNSKIQKYHLTKSSQKDFEPKELYHADRFSNFHT